MRTVIFNNQRFEDLGLILRKNPVPECITNNYDIISIPDGPVLFENKKTRDPLKIPIECTVLEPNKLRDIYAMVQKKGRLILPDETGKYYNAVLQINTPENIILHYNNISFTAVCEPWAYAVSNPEQTLTLSEASWYKYTTASNNGSAVSEPKYIVTASGQFGLNIGGGSADWVNFKITAADTVTVDIQKMLVYNSQNQSILNLTEGNLSKLKLNPGANWLGCGQTVSSLKIVKNERWY